MCTNFVNLLKKLYTFNVFSYFCPQIRITKNYLQYEKTIFPIFWKDDCDCIVADVGLCMHLVG